MKRKGWKDRRGVLDRAQSGLRECPPRAFPLGAHAKPIIAASERELREMMRSRMNIGYGGALVSYRLIPDKRFSRFNIPAAEKK